MRGFRGIKRFRGDCPLRIWLARIVIRVSINHHPSLSRRLKRWVFFGDLAAQFDDGSVQEFEPPDPAGFFDREAMVDIGKHVNRLPDEFRMPLVMLAVEGMTIPEISTILEIPEGTVKSRIFYARKRLKDTLAGRKGKAKR
jgi:RNA polymerase sigma-70 factor (ECF subfamily)